MKAYDLVNFPCQMSCRDTIKCTACVITRRFVLTPQHMTKPHYFLAPKLRNQIVNYVNIFHLGTTVKVY
jgi:hypothetical protein